MTVHQDHPEFAELRECEAILNSPAYPAMSDEDKTAFVVRYNSAAAKARQAAGRTTPLHG